MAMHEPWAVPARPVRKRARQTGEGLRAYDRAWLWFSRVLIWLSIVFALFPIVSVVFASLGPGESFFHPSIWPERWTLENYANLFDKGLGSEYLIWVKNTFIVAMSVAVVTTLITVLAAFGYSRMRFPGRRFALMVVFLLQMFPAAMSIPALFGVLAKVGGLDTLWGLILVMCGTGAFGIWLVKNYIDNIPRELDEAAMVDGATSRQIFLRIILPLAKPMIIVQFLWGFMSVINEYAISAVILKSGANYTLPLGLKTFSNDFATKWGVFAAATLLSSVPVVILWMINQRWVQQGLTQGAIKG